MGTINWKSIMKWFELTNRGYYLLSVFVILLTGYICMGFWGNNGFFIYDDHPKRILYLWNFIRQGGIDLWAWDPWVNAGEPSLVLYPPCDALLGALIDLITFRSMPLEEVYRITLIIVYYLPGFAALLFCRQIGISRIGSLLTALIVMLYQGNYMGSDVDGSIKIGMMCGRLAISFVILACYFTVKHLENCGGIFNTVGMVCALSGIVLSNPCHFYNVFLSISIFWYFLSHKKMSDFLWVLLVGGIAFGLCAFWLIPGLYYQEFVVLSFIKEFALKDMFSLIFQLKPFFILYLVGLMLMLMNGCGTRKMWATMLLPIGVILAVWFDCVILYKFLGIGLFDPWRVSDAFHFSLLLAFGITLEYLGVKTVKGVKQRIASVVLILCLVFIMFKPYVNLPQDSAFASKSPAHYKVFNEIYKIDNLWRSLKNAPKGRVLFTSSAIYYHSVFFYSPWRLWHTHFFGLTPIFTNREIIGGTAGMLSPVACYLYYGGKQNKLTNWVESFDDHTLFGMDYEKDIDEKRLFNICKKLNITTIVIGEYEPRALSFFLQAKEHFYQRERVGIFYVFGVKDYQGTYLDFVPQQVNAMIIQYIPNKKIEINVLNSCHGAGMTLKISYFPWWEAYCNGKKLKIESDEIGLMRFMLPEGKNYTVIFKYRIPVIMRISLCITLLTLISILIVIGYLVVIKKEGTVHG